MKKFMTLFFALCLILCNIVSAEKYQIVNEIYFINGITGEQHLQKKVKIDHKRIFTSQDELQSYISDLIQQYKNLRTFDDIQIDFFTSQPSSENENLPSAVSLQIKILDSKNFIVLPYYKYDSKDGHVLKAKLKNSNAFGTLNELEAELYFGINQGKTSDNLEFTFGGAFNYSLPFYFGIIEASWNNDLDFSYTIAKEMPEWKGNTGFTFKIPLERISFDLTLTQKIINDFDYKVYNDSMYFGEVADFSIPIKLEVFENWGDLVYTPSVNYTYNWKINDKINLKNDELISPELLFSNKISAGRVNWDGNFRKGFSTYLRQDAGYNFLIDDMIIGFEGEFSGFLAGKFVGFASRVYAFSYMNKNKKIGNRLRGIRDDEFFNPVVNTNDIYACSTPSALVVNLDLPIHIFTTDFEKIGLKFLRKLNFELQISPFIDFALYTNRATGSSFELKDGYYTAGIEFLVFPLRWKSLQIRASAGFDIGSLLFKDLINTSWRPAVSVYEISFGIGLHY